jgi:voltage-gated potassium channel
MNIFYRYIHWRRNILLSFEEDVIKFALFRSIFLLLSIIVLHVACMTAFESFSWQDALWLTLTTLSTTGYGDISATTPEGKTATVILLYFGGIFILAKAAGDYFEYRASIRLKKIYGFWAWNMSDHILMINSPSQQGEQFFMRLLKHLRHGEMKETTVQILTDEFPTGLPSQLSRMSGLAHYTGCGTVPSDLIAASAEKAKYIVILSKQENNRESDTQSFDILHRLQELKLREDVIILAECVDDENRPRFRQAGASVIIRPMRAYPEMLIRGLIAPGAEQIIENLFSSLGDLYLRFEVDIKEVAWKDIVCQLIQQDFGTAVAYLDIETQQCHTNPHANKKITTHRLFVMIKDDNPPKQKEIQQALADLN